MEQKILSAKDNYIELDNYLKSINAKKILLVCGPSIKYLNVNDYFNNIEKLLNIKIIRFSDFSPNPMYESVINGVKIYKQNNCDSIIAVGGGSAIDVAKCIKLFSTMDENENYLKQPIVPNNIPFLVIPTTAGTGSEATRYSVIYYNGEKQSVTDNSSIPNTILFDVSVLETLPLYQKKVTMLDALCHSIESLWSINSNKESKDYAKEAIKIILENIESYLNNDVNGNSNMQKAAYLAGKAINITQTTAGHAMCYKLTGLYNISHGQACAMCVNVLFPYMINNIDKCIDPRGKDYLKNIFEEISLALGSDNLKNACDKFTNIYNRLKLEKPIPKETDFETLINSVNPIRLKNHPIKLEKKDIDILYRKMLS